MLARSIERYDVRSTEVQYCNVRRYCTDLPYWKTAVTGVLLIPTPTRRNRRHVIGDEIGRQHVALTVPYRTVPPSWQYCSHTVQYCTVLTAILDCSHSSEYCSLSRAGLCLAPLLSRPPHASSEPSFMHGCMPLPSGFLRHDRQGLPGLDRPCFSISAVPFPPQSPVGPDCFEAAWGMVHGAGRD